VTFPRATAATDLRAALVTLGALKRFLHHTEAERLVDSASRRLWKVLVMLEPQRAKVLERMK
jgi:hypothetical protein